MNANIEARLTRLEELSYFQEEKLKELDAVLASQRAALDALEKKTDALREALRHTRDFLEASRESAEREIPPHFGQAPWR